MTDPIEVAAFMRTIIERPDDDVPRLVFADYLDERGKAERAEFIRVQCELARLKLTCPCRGYYCTRLTCDWTNDYGSLRRRERELLPLAKHDFAAQLPRLNWEAILNVHRHLEISYEDGHMDVGFVRGFVEIVETTWALWQRHADAIRAATPLRVVRLTTWPDDALYEPFNAEWPGIRFEMPPPIRFIRESGPVSRDGLLPGYLTTAAPRDW